MTKLKFDTSRCKGCGLCVMFCPTKSLTMSSDLNEQGQPYPVCDEATCTTCGLCFRMCPDAAIEVNTKEKKATCKSAVEKTDG